MATWNNSVIAEKTVALSVPITLRNTIVVSVGIKLIVLLVRLVLAADAVAISAIDAATKRDACAKNMAEEVDSWMLIIEVSEAE